MLNQGYIALSSLLIVMYGWATYNGWELGDAQRQVVPAEARQAKGWYRSPAYHYHSGYRGGK